MKTSTLSAPPIPIQSCSITVVVAAFNEQDNLKYLLLALEQTFQNLGFILSVLLIDDGSTDHSSQVLKQLGAQYSFLRVIRHPQRKGLTGVLQTALANTTSDWLYLTPADLESNPYTDLPLLLEACVSGVDAVAGWRQGRKDGKSFASAIANCTCCLAFRLQIHDMNWIKLVRRDLLAALPLEQVTYRYLLPVLAGWGYRIAETPTPYHLRQHGKSKFGSKRLISSAIDFWKLWWWFQTKGRLLNPLKQKDNV